MAQRVDSTDELAVLSLHQPWASLLVHGIKRIEGRTWPTKHRGRLWIHATSTAPSPDDIQDLEAFYSAVHGEEGNVPAFPSSYPQGALLGSVDVVDCVENAVVCEWEQVRASVKQEAQSPFCWLCEHPQRLVVPQKMPGQRRIWRLPSKQMVAGMQRALKGRPASAARRIPRRCHRSRGRDPCLAVQWRSTVQMRQAHGSQPGYTAQRLTSEEVTMARGAAPRLVAGVTLVYFIVAVTAAPLQAQQGLDNDDLQTDGMQLASSTASALGSSAPQQISAPGNSPQQSGRADDASSGAWSVLPKRTGGRRERSSPAQFRRHGPFAKAALPSVLWTLDPADDGGELVAGVEAEALSAARAVAAAARELASRALGFEL